MTQLQIQEYSVDQSSRFNVAYLVYLDHDVDPLYLWTGHGKLEFDTGDGEQTWVGCHSMGSISFPEESPEISVESITLTLSAVDPQTAEIITQEDVRGKSCTLWRVFMDDERRVVECEEVADTVQDFVSFTLTDDGLASITLTALDKFGYLAEQSVRKLTPEYVKIKMAENGITDPVSGADQVHTLPGDTRSWFY